MKRLALLIVTAGSGEFGTDPAEAHTFARLGARPVEAFGIYNPASVRT